MIKIICDAASDLYDHDGLQIISTISPKVNLIDEAILSKHIYWDMVNNNIELKTTQVTEFDLINQIKGDIELGYNEFIVVTISSSASGFYNNCKYIENCHEFGNNIKIKIIDSHQVSYCIGIPILECQEKILNENISFVQAIEFLENELPKYIMYYIVPDNNVSRENKNGRIQFNQQSKYSIMRTSIYDKPCSYMFKCKNFYEARRKILYMTKNMKFIGKIRSDSSIKKYIGEFGGSLVSTFGVNVIGFLFKIK